MKHCKKSYWEKDLLAIFQSVPVLQDTPPETADEYFPRQIFRSEQITHVEWITEPCIYGSGG